MQTDPVARRPQTALELAAKQLAFTASSGNNDAAVKASKAFDEGMAVVDRLEQGAKAAKELGKNLKFQADVARLMVLKLDAIAAAATGDAKRAKAIAKEVAGIAKELHGMVDTGGGGGALASVNSSGVTGGVAVAGQSTSTVTTVSASGVAVAAQATIAIDSATGQVTETVRAVAIGPSADRTGVKEVVYNQSGTVGYSRTGAAVHATAASHSTLTQVEAGASGESISHSSVDIEADAAVTADTAGPATEQTAAGTDSGSAASTNSGSAASTNSGSAAGADDGFAKSVADAEDLARKIIDFLRRAFGGRRGVNSQDMAQVGRELAAATIANQPQQPSTGALVDLAT